MMGGRHKRGLFGIAAFALLASADPAMAQTQWQVGQRVMVGSTGQQGTVIAILGPQMMNGGTLIRVHLDSMGSGFPNVGVAYDTVAAQITPMGGAAPAPQAPPPPPAYQPQQQYQAPQPTYPHPPAAAPANEGPPGLGPPPDMNAPARPGSGPAQ
jgi:hypothetical protein